MVPTEGSSSHSTAASPCLEESAAAGFVSGVLSPSDRVRFERHVVACVHCQSVVDSLSGAEGARERSPAVPTLATEGPLAAGPLSAGAPFGRYVIRELLGQGGMGTVYRAHDTVLLRDVALKIIRDATARQGMIRRWMREARAVAALAHPNIVSIYDMGEFAGTSFLAMEFVPGDTLRARINGHRAPLATRLMWLESIANALVAAHSRGIVHRDIKPENVIVRADGLCKVLDFGLARWLDDRAPHDAADTRTHEGAVMGTPAYMAPEQLRGETVDERTDQFGWGVVAFEVLTGRRPWTADAGAYAVGAEILTTDAPPIRAIDPDLPRPLELLVTRALARDASERFQSMAEIVAALEANRAGVVSDGPAFLTERASAPSMEEAPARSVAAPPSSSPIGTVAGETSVERRSRGRIAAAAGSVLVVASALYGLGRTTTAPLVRTIGAERSADRAETRTTDEPPSVPSPVPALRSAAAEAVPRDGGQAPPEATAPHAPSKPLQAETPRPTPASRALRPITGGSSPATSKPRPAPPANGAPILDPE